MTDIELLPLPEARACTAGTRRDCWVADEMEAYTRANMAPLIAEIERLRADVEAWKSAHGAENDACHHFQGKAREAETRAERLAEALRELVVDMERAQANMRNAAKTDLRWEGCADAIQPRVDAARAALRDHDQEVGNG